MEKRATKQLKEPHSCPLCSAPVFGDHGTRPGPDTAAVCSCWRQGSRKTGQTTVVVGVPDPVELKMTEIQMDTIYHLR